MQTGRWVVESDAIQIAKKLCILFEGMYLKPYLCPAGIPTIGVGSTHYENGARVSLTDPPITPERAEQLLMWELRSNCAPRVLKLCSNLPEWGPGATAAIMDFVYNLGSGNLQSSTLRKKILSNDREGAKEELMKWVRGGGRVLPGLVRRRTAECTLMG